MDGEHTDSRDSSDSDATAREATALARSEAVFTAERPWGQFQQFVLNEICTVKIITVEAGHRLSLQRHDHREEMWQVLDVPMDVQVGDRAWTAGVGERVFVPADSLHRLGNSGTQSGRILEIAFGAFDERDITRLHDDYARPPQDDESITEA